jgi:hypothetical protein
MPSFSAEHSAAWNKRANDLGRDLTYEEDRVLQGELVAAWIAAERFDELITKFLRDYGREGGHVDLVVLGNALRRKGDIDRVNMLFRSLVTRRTSAFWQSWPKAESGQVGHMQEAAKYMSEAMVAYREYYLSLDALGMVDEREALRAEMLMFQGRTRPKKVRNNPK